MQLLEQIDSLHGRLRAEEAKVAKLSEENERLSADVRSLAQQLKQERAAGNAVLKQTMHDASNGDAAESADLHETNLATNGLTLASAASQILMLRREVKFLQKQWNSTRRDVEGAARREQVQQLQLEVIADRISTLADKFDKLKERCQRERKREREKERAKKREREIEQEASDANAASKAEIKADQQAQVAAPTETDDTGEAAAHSKQKRLRKAEAKEAKEGGAAVASDGASGSAAEAEKQADGRESDGKGVESEETAELVRAQIAALQRAGDGGADGGGGGDGRGEGGGAGGGDGGGLDAASTALAELERVRMTEVLLRETGVGKAVNRLKKSFPPLEARAKALVERWKGLVQPSA